MLNQGWIYRERVAPRDAGQSLLEHYTLRYPHSSRDEWQARILAGQVQVDEQPAELETPLKVGQRLSYHRPPWQEPVVPLGFELLYDDQDVLAVAKPAGLPVLPGGGFLQHTLWWQLQQRYPEQPPVPVHRLGRGTSGVLLLARSPLARASLSQQLRDHTAVAARSQPNEPSIEAHEVLQKVYLALVEPGPIPDVLPLQQSIGRLPHPNLGYVYGATPLGLPAYSEARVLQRYSDRTLLEVQLYTGRPHQIRIHLAAAGYPLLGDPLYGPGGQLQPAAAEAWITPGDCGYWLHAHRLRFRHPRTGAAIALVCPPPPGYFE